MCNVVGASKSSETAITVSGLRPDHFYSIRVIAVNAGSFQAASRIVRLRTLGPVEQGTDGAEDASCVRTRSGSCTSAVSDGESHVETAVIHPLSHPVQFMSHNVTTPATDTDHGETHNHPLRQSISHRKAASSNEVPDLAPSSHADPKNEEKPVESEEIELTVDQLKEKLEAIRRETEDIQILKVKEDEDFQATKASLINERDRLKQALKERDDASADLRREVAHLERQNRTAQSRKTAKEKLLHQKQNERQKMRQEMERWNQEAVEYQRETEKLEKQKHDLLEATDEKVNEVRERIKEWQRSIKEMEEDIRLKGARIKEFEQERKKLQGEEDDAGAVGRERRAREEDENWELRLGELQATYAKLSFAIQQVSIA